MNAVTIGLPLRSSEWAHAIKNCLATVEAVNRLIEGELCDVSRARLGRSQKALRRILHLVSEDLAAPPISWRSRPGHVDVSEVLETVVTRVADIAAANGVELVVQQGAGTVVGDAVDLTEAFGNVVLNALQATRAGGSVFVGSYEEADGAQLWFVEDTGSGMTEDVCARLGERGFTRRAGGSGIGFRAAREAVERHGGAVHVESEAGRGTVVFFWLPRAC